MSLLKLILVNLMVNELEHKWFVENLLYKSVKSGLKNVTSEIEEEEVFEESHF